MTDALVGIIEWMECARSMNRTGVSFSVLYFSFLMIGYLVVL